MMEVGFITDIRKNHGSTELSIQNFGKEQKRKLVKTRRGDYLFIRDAARTFPVWGVIPTPPDGKQHVHIIDVSIDGVDDIELAVPECALPGTVKFLVDISYEHCSCFPIKRINVRSASLSDQVSMTIGKLN
jgi:hypothetical protein